MVKNKTTDDNIMYMPDIPGDEYPAPLIQKLCTFYNKYPDYKTGIVDISILARIVHTELDKFTRRPHKQVTEVFFDRDVPGAFGV